MKQYSFDPLDYDNPQEAKEARNRHYKDLKSKGVTWVKRWVLKNQLRPYAGLGQPDGRIRDIYFINTSEV